MKKGFSILVVSVVITGIALSLIGIALVSQAAPANKDQSSNRQIPKPVSATNVQIVQKVLLSLDDIREAKGKPDKPPGQDKDKGPKDEETATGVLGDPATGDKYAVIIGICDYPGETSLDLCGSDGDALHMYKALVEIYGYEPENIRLFKDAGGTTGFVNSNTEENIIAGIPTRDNILGAIMDIKEDPSMSSDDEVVFFYSGHGANGTADDGDNESTDEAIVVWDTEEDVADNITYIWDGELKTAFSDFATDRIAFVFDTCLAGGWNDVVADGRIVNMATEETKSAYVYSTAGEDVDGDGTKDGEGVFSRLFVNEGMLQGLADEYNQLEKTDGNVAVEEAFYYAKENIPRPLKGRQKPVISDGFTDDLLL